MARLKVVTKVPEQRRPVILDLHDVGVHQFDISTHYSMPQSIVCNIKCKGGPT